MKRPEESRRLRLLLVTAAVAGSTATAGLALAGASDLSAVGLPQAAVASGGERADAQARRLAASITSATTPAARYGAVLQIMRALHVRVYSSRGKVLSPGAGDLPRSFALYDVEVRSIAAALARDETKSLDVFSQTLTAVGVTDGSEPLSPPLLRQVLLGGVASAANSLADRRSVVPLLVRELGRQHRQAYDLLKATPLARIRLDALQSFLLLADIVLPAQTGVPAARRLADAAPAAAPAASPCSSTGATIAGEVMPFGKWALTLTKMLGKPIKLAAVAIDAIHGPILAFSVDVKAKGPNFQRTHYGPPGHEVDAGKELRFQLLVQMRDDLGEGVINCGRLIGMKFPKKGPIPGVTVLWETQGLAKHGTISYEPSSKKTGSDGIATLVFKPKNEKSPGVGIVTNETGVVNGVAAYQSAFGNIPGTLAQFLTPKYDGIRWEVGHHDEGLVLDMETTARNEKGAIQVRLSGLQFTVAEDGSIRGKKALEIVSYSYDLYPPDCKSTPQAQPGRPFEVLSLTIDASNPSSPAIRMTVYPGSIDEKLAIDCGDRCSPDDCPYVGGSNLYAAWWTDYPEVMLTEWEYQNNTGPVYARRTLKYDSGDGYVAEAKFELRRVPPE